MSSSPHSCAAFTARTSVTSSLPMTTAHAEVDPPPSGPKSPVKDDGADEKLVPPLAKLSTASRMTPRPRSAARTTPQTRPLPPRPGPATSMVARQTCDWGQRRCEEPHHRAHVWQQLPCHRGHPALVALSTGAFRSGRRRRLD
jgi:hypothetical protein